METGGLLFCAHCGGGMPPAARFCRYCGYPLRSLRDSGEALTSQGGIPLKKTPISAEMRSTRILKGRYRLVGLLGTGGYGQVYRAVDTAFMQRTVAIKEMLQQGLSSQELEEAVDGFKREATLLASLTHPNLPSIYDYFCEDGNWYVVMSYIEGETLEEYVQHKGGKLSAEKTLQIGIQLATALSFLHTRKPPIIFRDLKPANVMHTYQGQIYLIDFGIARHFKPGQSKDTLVLGSPGYAAPEQYGRAQTTPQTDIYSLGALLHELISGIQPSLAPFSQRPLSIPGYPQLSNLISCMLAIDVKKRPVCMGNIQRELQRIAVRYVLPSSSMGLPVPDQKGARKISPPRLPRSFTQKMFRINQS